jgi:hypothetical protein
MRVAHGGEAGEAGCGAVPPVPPIALALPEVVSGQVRGSLVACRPYVVLLVGAGPAAQALVTAPGALIATPQASTWGFGRS